MGHTGELQRHLVGHTGERQRQGHHMQHHLEGGIAQTLSGRGKCTSGRGHVQHVQPSAVPSRGQPGSYAGGAAAWPWYMAQGVPKLSGACSNNGLTGTLPCAKPTQAKTCVCTHHAGDLRAMRSPANDPNHLAPTTTSTCPQQGACDSSRGLEAALLQHACPLPDVAQHLEVAGLEACEGHAHAQVKLLACIHRQRLRPVGHSERALQRGKHNEKLETYIHLTLMLTYN